MTEKIKRTNKFNLDGLGAKRAVKKPFTLRAWQKILIATISGAILALAGPGFDNWWLAWLMVAPFLVMLSFCHGNLEAILVGLGFGLGYHCLSLHYYLDVASYVNGQGLARWRLPSIIWLGQVLELSLPTILFAWFVSILPLRPGFIPFIKRPFFPYLIAVPMLWIFLHWGLSAANNLANVWQVLPFPVICADPLVYSQYSVLPLLQILHFIGPSGLEFFILLFNSALAAFLLEVVKKHEGPLERVDSISPRAGALIDLGVAATLVVVIYYFGQIGVNSQIRESKQIGEISVGGERMQPIVPVCIILDPSSLGQNKMPDILRDLAITVFPEVSERESATERAHFLDSLKESTLRNHNTGIFNSVGNEGQSSLRRSAIVSGDQNTNFKQKMDTARVNKFPLLNSVLANDAGSNLTSSSLLPGLQEWLFVANKHDPSSWYSLDMPKLRWGKVGLLSGSDLEDFRLVADEVRRGASLIISSANLSWLNNKCLNEQLLAAAIFRAVENHRYVILCAKDGVSAVIEPNGAVQSMNSPVGKVAAKQTVGDTNLLLGTVQFLWSKTPFTKSWWI